MIQPSERRSRRTAFGLAAALLLATAGSAEPMSGGDHAIDWYTIDGGGGTSTAGEASVSGTIGQPDAGVMTGGSYSLAGGFWQAGGAGAPCPGDIDGTNEVDFDDLLRVLGAWGPCAGCPEDLNGDDAVGFDDLLIVLGAWGPCL